MVGTKADKLKANEKEGNLKRIRHVQPATIMATHRERAARSRSSVRDYTNHLLSEAVLFVLARREGLELPDDQPIAFSSATGAGKSDVWKYIQQVCAAPRKK